MESHPELWQVTAEGPKVAGPPVEATEEQMTGSRSRGGDTSRGVINGDKNDG
jgi:hypothetical protein